MTTFNEHDHPRQSNGQFADKPSISTGITLASPHILSGYRVNSDFPIPQANDLDRVITVIAATDDGIPTSAAIASYLGVTEREGAYYADAAGYLGLVDKRNEYGATVYEPTALGREVIEADDDYRSQLINGIVSEVPAVRALMEGGTDAQVADSMNAAGLGESTAGRRTSTSRSWLNQIRDADELSARVHSSRDECSQRTDDARRRALNELEEARERYARTTERPQVICPECFMTVPASGLCDCGWQTPAAA